MLGEGQRRGRADQEVQEGQSALAELHSEDTAQLDQGSCRAEPASKIGRQEADFSDEIESKVAEAAIAASKDNRPQTISRIREQLQTLVTGSSL